VLTTISLAKDLKPIIANAKKNFGAKITLHVIGLATQMGRFFLKKQKKQRTYLTKHGAELQKEGISLLYHPPGMNLSKTRK